MPGNRTAPLDRSRTYRVQAAKRSPFMRFIQIRLPVVAMGIASLLVALVASGPAAASQDRHLRRHHAAATPHYGYGGRAGPAGKSFELRSCLALNPRAGTLEIRADLRTKIEQPLSRKSCILDLIVYLGDALVDRCKLCFQHRYAVLEALDGVRRLVQEKLVDIHQSAEPG